MNSEKPSLSNRQVASLETNFVYHKPTEEQAEKYTLLRQRAKELAELIYSISPESREQSLAITKLEECVMWANAGIARNIPA